VVQNTNPFIRSLASAERISRQAEFIFGLSFESALFLHQGSNDVYLLHTVDDSYIARLCVAQRWDEEEIEAEQVILRHLHSLHLSVPEPLFPDADCSREVKAPEGARFLCLFRCLPGEVPYLINADICARMGETLARLHIGLQKAPPLKRWKLDQVGLVDSSLQVLRKSFAGESQRIQKLEDQVLSLCPAFLEQKDPQLIHADFRPGNVLTRKAELSILDFDFMGYGDIHYDLATMKWALCREFEERKAFGLMDIFLDSYRGTRKDIQVDQEKINFFVGLRELWVWGFTLREGTHFIRLSKAEFETHLHTTLQWLDAASTKL
jgi:Ser/Thr protein kinase RdoA (MazF antagonist)